MSYKDTKAILKEMRDDIKAARFAEAVEKGTALLYEDPQNYMCHLLLGAAYQNVNKTEAAKHLRKAVEYCAPTPPTVALQGLANCAPIEELPLIYVQLLRLLPEKYADYYQKLYIISENRNVTQQCFDLFRRESQKKSEVEEQQRLSLLYLAKLWITFDFEVEASDEELYKAAIETLIAADEQDDTVKLLNAYKRYLKLLYKRKDLNNCLKIACNVVERYPDDIYAYEWICKIYCEHYNANETADCLAELYHPIQHYAKRLLELNSESSLACLVNAIDLYAAEQYVGAYDLLIKVQNIQPNYVVAVELLARVEMKLDAYEMAIPLWLELDKKTCLEYAICLSHSNEENRLHEALQLLEKSEQNNEVVHALARCYYRLQDFSKLKALKLDIVHQAEFLMTPSEAIIALQANCDPESFETLFLLGRLYTQQRNFADALNCMLKATRLQSYRSLCFYNLGCIYYATGDKVRARKCYEKCINMNPTCVDAVYNLSAIYQEAKEEDLNMALLLNALNHMKSQDSQRIHYKLGLHYLSANKWDDAIHSFREAIKYDVNCIIYWESLGDAYADRGSYHSAIRVFQKLLEMDAMNVYAKLQLALLKTTLRMYTEAICDFDSLLNVHPNYIPGLKGATEAHLGLAHNLKLDHCYGRCREHLQLALNHIQNAFFSSDKHDKVWLWRLAAKVFITTACLPTSRANLKVSGKLAKNESAEHVTLERTDLLNLATRFYSCAVKLKPNTFLWYELALCYYNCALYMPTEAKTRLEMAENACKMAIQTQNDRWQNWNFLGVIQMHKEIDNLEFAQHCFVQALNIERKSYTTWTNLGVLYLQLKEIKLANQAFQRAQQSSPVYGNAWIGQAMIAEAIAEEEEALDLFRHCLQFEYHPESAIGYAHWICKELMNYSTTSDTQYKNAIKRMHADVVALEAIDWYTANEEENASVAALSFQGFLNIHQKLYRPATRAYLEAIKKCSPGAERDKILTNLGYLYLKMNQPNDALNVFNMVAEATFKPIIGLALAYFGTEQHQEAYMVYSSVLKSLDGSDDHKAACILVAMSAMLYASQGEADTKSMLSQCIPLKDAPIQAIYSAFALGLLHSDTELTEAMFTELKKYQYQPEHCAHIAYLVSQYYAANQRVSEGLQYLKSILHIIPFCNKLRRVMADYLNENYLNENVTENLVGLNASAARMALSIINLSHRNNETKNDYVKDAECLSIASRALLTVNQAASRILLQQALHLNPLNKNAWTIIQKII